MKIGFIGLGVMGAPMAGHLLAAGHELFARSRSGVPSALLEGGATGRASAKAVAHQSEIIILMLPDTPDVETVLFGEEGVAGGLSPGKLVIDMSSISPAETRAFAGKIEQLGCAYVDAPVSGGELGARNAALTIMAGGTDDAFQRARPLFEKMGKSINHIGPVGAGQVAKAANQIIVALTIEAVCEALLFASKAGVDPARVREALMGGFAASRVLEVHGKRMIDRTFDPGFRMELHRKDLGLALQGAREMGMALPGTAACAELMNAAMASGGGGWDHSALVKVLERLANHSLGDAP